ncbi:DUF7260 family protein [Haladaptatus halobius]|uniref:DUF7260 family protein n=1 Tax=Haladaptatus halobius TaxID=2884875 RepID=UPI001D0BCE62|nr:hypothetical protein [Haladaptatus halobius]
MAQSRNRLVEQTSLPDAQRCLTEEKAYLQAEIDAFEDFLNRLAEIPPHPYQTDGGPLHDTVYSQSPPSHTFQGAVETAYCETVLAVEHWDDAYGEETVLESITNEFGADVAAGLTGGSATWSRLLWNELQSASEVAIETRQQTLPILTVERQQLEDLCESLAEIGDELAAIERGEYFFAERSDRLTTIQEELEELTYDQQVYLRQRKPSDEGLFSSIVYVDLDTEYPGLAALATARQLLDRIEVHHWAGKI